MTLIEPVVLADGLAFPEGPAFDGDGALWCVELRGGRLARWRDGRIERIPAGGAPNGLAFDRAGRLWVCDAERNAVRRFDPRTGAWETVADAADGKPLDKPNDLAFDAAGNLLFTCPGDSRREPAGYVCCRRPHGKTSRIAAGMYFPNGLALADGGTTLWVAETYRKRLWKGAWDARETRWIDPAPVADVGGAPGPDGMAVGADGNVYVAVYGAGAIRVVDPRGKIVGEYPVPGANPTNVAFDPSGRLGLVVTETERGQILALPGLGPGAALYTMAADIAGLNQYNEETRKPGTGSSVAESRSKGNRR
jgi:gluconolactonase